MKLARFTAALLIASSLAAPAFAHVTKTTDNFIANATIGNKFEIDASKIALDRSEDPTVREFAKMMVEDHSHALETMKSVVPSDANPSLGAVYDAKHDAELTKLQNIDAKKFDAEYVTAQTKAHDEAVGLFASYARKGDEKDLKDFAAATLPTLKAHQAAIKSFRHTKHGYVAAEGKTPVSKHMDEHRAPMGVERH